MVTQVRTVEFLPEIFRTETNSQFLGATLDVLTSQPELQRIGGYIGNKYGYGINPDDKYIVEPTKSRSDYQLQPSVVFLKPDTQLAKDYISYPGIINALDNAGANTTNHERLFSAQFYSWDPFIDLDKAVNYAQYYWIPRGPDAIAITGGVNVDTDILGKANYTSPNGVKFTNGLKVWFSEGTTPGSYANVQYYVEGVGTAIVLRPVSNYTVPEAPGEAVYNPWDTANYDTDNWDADLYVSVRPEYITISRNSDDMNAWTRANRWFHQDVLDETTKQLGRVTTAVGNTVSRAARPIVEFRGNLQLYNSGSSSVGAVNLFDTTTTNALAQVVGQTSYTVDGVQLMNGMRVVFAVDDDETVRSTVFTVGNTAGIIVLSPTTVVTTDNAQTWVLNGNTRSGTTWRYNADVVRWVQCQQKSTLNQQPLYDVVTQSGVSYGNAAYYSGTSFAGCPLFTYTPNPSGVDDPVLGFPLTYSGVNNIGDISFTVNFNTQTFSYIDSSGVRVSQPVNSGYVQQYGSSPALLSGWIPAAAPSVQYQVFQFTVDADNTITFTLDVPLRTPSVWASAIVYVNDEILDRSSYSTAVSGNSSTVTLNKAVDAGVRVTILALSDTPSATAYYEVPVNLQNNPFNGDVTRVDVGDLRNQYRSIYSNAPGLVGPLWGDNNYHDLPPLNKYGTAIIQNSSSLVLPSVFLRKSDADYFAALGYSAQQYQLYKDLLVDIAGTNDYSIEQTPAQVLDSIVYEITTIRKNSTAFFWTDMLPSGSPYLVNNYSVGVNTNLAYYNLSRVYDYNTANYYGVSLYVTRNVSGIQRQIQLLRGIDYTVSSAAPTVTVHTQLLGGDVVTVREYNQTYGTYCPSTPTSLGLYPATVPHIMTDNGAYYIVGHDGSINRLYGEYNGGYLQDFRDIALYEFEKRVYNNIKINDALPLIYDEVNPGQWRTTEYSYSTIQDIYRTEFLNWVGSNRIDYKTQQYNLADRFTYNYNQSSNKLNIDCSHLLQGYWRGIYRYMYDTENPAATPWQMLGYANKPDWWDTYYSWTDPSKRVDLINALKQGKTGNPMSPTINPLYARPQIESVLPVDELGALRNPFDAVVGNYNRLTFQRNWVAGDGAPAEATYWKSSAWPFAVMRLLALTKPAKFFNLFADRDRYVWNSQFGQYLYNGRQHLDPRTLTVYGNGTAVHSYINWIVDYINVRGVNGHDTVSSLIRNTDVRLTYNLAGFSSKDHLQFYIERATPNSKNTSLLVPDENYAVLLYHNVPEEVVRYSSIIIQRTELGWTVWGNSQNTAYFTVAVPEPNGNTSIVGAAGTTVRVSNDYSTATATVPYGTLFYSVQAVSEFIRSYGQHLIDQGVAFDNIYDNVVYDWIRMVEEFLAWSQQSWTVGSTIALNPNAKTFVVNRPGLVVQPLTVYRDNFILNQNLLPVQQQNSAVYRNNTAFTVKILNDGDTVGYTNLHLASIEHAIVFDNTTSFNDLLYNPVTGLRQNRLLLKGYKTAGWKGYINANGFILSEDNIEQWQPSAKYAKGSIVTYKDKYWVAPQLIEPSSVFPQNLWQTIDKDRIKLGMLPNPSAASVESALYYNSNIANLELDADLLSFSLIGYRPRDYLAAADLSDITQINVYKNIVREKGTYQLANSFRYAQFDQGRIEYDIYENWALHTADFGAVLGSNYVEALLDQHRLTGNPTIVAFSEGDPEVDAQQTVYLNQLVGWQRPPLDAHFLPPYNTPYTDEIGLPSAGYVNSDTVTHKIYQYSDANADSTLLGSTLVNNTLWVARYNNSWDVFSALSVGTQIAAVQNNQNGTMTVSFTGFHNLSENDPFAIVSFDNEVDGFYTVSSVNNVFAVTVVHTMNPGTLLLTGNGVALKLQSRRFAQPSDVAQEYLPFNGLNSRRVWVDNDSNGSWSVWRCTPSYSGVQFPNTLNAGGSVAYSSSVGYLLGNPNSWTVYQTGGIGATPIPFGVTPGFGAQIVIGGNSVVITSNDWVYYYRVTGGGLVYTQRIAANSAKSVALSSDGRWLYISAAGTISVWRLNTATNNYEAANIISTPLDALGWGHSIATSTDGSKLFVGAPQQTVAGLSNAGALYVYSRVTERYLIEIPSTSVTLSFLPPNNAIDVFVNGVLSTAYTFSGVTITFNTTLPVGTVVSVATARIFLQESHTSPNPRLGGLYGHSVATNRWGADVVVGAPYEITNLGGATTVEGSVYRYTNGGQRYGVVTLTNPNVIAGDQIWLNGYRVLWEGATTDAATIANAINTQTPTNILATVSGNSITITLYDNTAETLYNLLDVVGSSAVLGRLNTNLYSRTQTIHAYNRPQTAQFGWSLAMNERDALVVGAPAAPRIAATTYDYTDDDNDNDTVFDNGATTFVDSFSNSGLAYLYEYLPAYNESISNPGAYTFAQYLTSTVPTNSNQPRWGSSIAARDGVIVVGSADYYGANSGQVITYSSNRGSAWYRENTPLPRVDINRVNNLCLYNRLDNTTLGHLDYCDPLQGKLLGAIASNLDYIGSSDPAGYDARSLQWGAEHIGRTWFDTTDYRLLNYNQSDLHYNATHWGLAFPGSVAPVYEWVESTVAPLAYTGEGIPYSPENYVEASVYDRSTNSIATRYYFWVRGLPSLPHGKTLSTAALSAYLLDPQASGIAFAAPLTTNAVALYNSADYIVSNTSVLHIGYGNAPSGDVMHTEWDLLQSGNPNSFLSGLPSSIRNEPSSTYLKYIDSFCGYDVAGQPVPDPRLPQQLRSGISFRPRQTMFINRDEALRNFIEYANRVMLRYPITETVTSLDFLNRYNSVNGSVLHPAVNAATTVNLIAGYSNGIAGVGAKLTGTGSLPTIDGVSLSPGARVLVKNQNNGLENGIYTVTSISAPWVLTRSYDFNGSGSGVVQNGDAVRVLGGSQANTAWAVQTPGTLQFGVSLIQFTAVSAADIPTLARPIYDVRDYWTTVDWWADGYSSATKPVIEVPLYADLQRITNNTIITGVNGLFIPLEDGLIARVTSNAAGNAETYVYTSAEKWTRIGVENGTIQILPALYSTYGWDSTTWSSESYTWDRNAAIETRYIIRWINECLYTEELQSERNRSLMLMFDYISSEVTNQRNYGQWLAKTSFIDVSHKVRNLSQYKLYQRDNTEFLTGFINEIKPYHVVIKDFIYKYSGEDIYEGNVTDFDLPAQYTPATGTYNTPQLVYQPTYETDQYTTTATIWTQQAYNQWFQNWGLHLADGTRSSPVATLAAALTAGNNTAVLNTVAGMADTGTVIIEGETLRYNGINRSSNTLLNLLRGFGGTVPSAHSVGASVRLQNVPFTVVDGARGYNSTPTLSVTNPSGYPAPRSTATAVVSTDSGVVSSIIATNLGSGYGGNPAVTISGSSIAASFNGTNINTANNTITITAHSFLNGDPVVFSSNANRYGLTVDSYYYVAVLDANTIALYLDRNAALTLGTAMQKVGSLDSERVRLSNVGGQNGTLRVTARVATTLAANPLRSVRTTLKFDRVSYRADMTGPETAAERIQRYYRPTVNMPGRVLSQLMSGVEYPHATVTPPGFTDTTTVLDSVLDGNSFSTTDTLYTISGGDFPDGYAPEELVAAVVTDALQIVVTSNDLPPTSGSGYVTGFSAYSGTISGTLPPYTNAIYTAVPTVTASGSGSGCRVNVRIVVQPGSTAVSGPGSSDQNVYISPAYPDTAANYTGYNTGDTLTIKGSTIGGVDGTNDITLTVGTIGGRTWKYTQTVNRFGIPVVYAGGNINGSPLAAEYYGQTWYSKPEGWNAEGGWDAASKGWDGNVSRNVRMTVSTHPAAVFLRTNNQ